MISVTQVYDPEILQTVFAIREKVFVVEQQVDPAEEYDEYEDTSTHYLATYDGVPCGTARWRHKGDKIKLERFAVLKAYRNKGVASAIMQQILQDVPKDKNLLLHAQLEAIPLYKKFGFKTFGPQFEEAGIQHFAMSLPPLNSQEA